MFGLVLQIGATPATPRSSAMTASTRCSATCGPAKKSKEKEKVPGTEEKEKVPGTVDRVFGHVLQIGKRKRWQELLIVSLVMFCKSERRRRRHAHRRCRHRHVSRRPADQRLGDVRRTKRVVHVVAGLPTEPHVPTEGLPWRPPIVDRRTKAKVPGTARCCVVNNAATQSNEMWL